jgi:hypothetical protein
MSTQALAPSVRNAGIAGILAGVGLIGEFALFSASGMQATTLDHAATALPFLRDHGELIRAATLVGAANDALAVILYAGLAARIRATAPTLAAAVLYLGVVAVVGDGLVALSYWQGIPGFVDLAGRGGATAAPAWEAFETMVSGFRGLADLFVGLALVALGAAGVAKRSLSWPLSAIALLTGVAAIGAPLGVGAAYLISLLLAIVFRLWAGVELFRGAGHTRHTTRLASADPA